MNHRSTSLFADACWAFSAAAAVEAAQCINDGIPCYNVSTQELLDCMATYRSTCDGGDPGDALEYIGQRGGLLYDSQYPPASSDPLVVEAAALCLQSLVSCSVGLLTAPANITLEMHLQCASV